MISVGKIARSGLGNLSTLEGRPRRWFPRVQLPTSDGQGQEYGQTPLTAERERMLAADCALDFGDSDAMMFADEARPSQAVG